MATAPGSEHGDDVCGPASTASTGGQTTQETLAERAGLSVNGIQGWKAAAACIETVRRLVKRQMTPEEVVAFQGAAQPCREHRRAPRPGEATCALPAAQRALLAAKPNSTKSRCWPTRLLTLTGVGCGELACRSRPPGASVLIRRRRAIRRTRHAGRRSRAAARRRVEHSRNADSVGYHHHRHQRASSAGAPRQL